MIKNRHWICILPPSVCILWGPWTVCHNVMDELYITGIIGLLFYKMYFCFSGCNLVPLNNEYVHPFECTVICKTANPWLMYDKAAGRMTYDKELKSRLLGCCSVSFLGFDNNLDFIVWQPGLQLFSVLLSLHLAIRSSLLDKKDERRSPFTTIFNWAGFPPTSIPP